MGFQTKIVYESVHQYNARLIERALQLKLNHYPLGVRLWRKPDAGPKYGIYKDKRVQKVGLFYNQKTLSDLKELKPNK